MNINSICKILKVVCTLRTLRTLRIVNTINKMFLPNLQNFVDIFVPVTNINGLLTAAMAFCSVYVSGG